MKQNQGISSLLKVQVGAGGSAEGVRARRSSYHRRPCGDVGALQVEMKYLDQILKRGIRLRLFIPLEF